MKTTMATSITAIMYDQSHSVTCNKLSTDFTSYNVAHLNLIRLQKSYKVNPALGQEK